MNADYEISILKRQVAALEQALNEVRRAQSLAEIQLPKAVRGFASAPPKISRAFDEGNG